MASKIILDNISVINNPSSFLNNIQLEITFTAIQAILDVLQWKIIYVGSAKNQEYDQILQEFQIGPITEESTMKFTVDCSPPDYTRIPRDQLICVTALIITVSYREQEFIRVGYYVHNVLNQEFTQQQRSNASAQQLINHTKRTILTDKPRITKFRIQWGNQSQMKQETNNNKIKSQSPYNSNNSLLGNKLRKQSQEALEGEQKLSTREEKEFNSQSIMKSQLINPSEQSSKHEEQQFA